MYLFKIEAVEFNTSLQLFHSIINSPFSAWDIEQVMTWPYPILVDIFFTQAISDFKKRSIFLKNALDEKVNIQGPHLAIKDQSGSLDDVLYIMIESGEFLSTSSLFVNQTLSFSFQRDWVPCWCNWSPSVVLLCGLL